MLTHLSVYNFAIVDHIELEFGKGLTTITGETGAGKSIILDALGLALGDRADSGAVNNKGERADIHATFDTSQVPAAQQWLQDNDLLESKESHEVLLRRVVTREGRSRGYINGHPVTRQNLKTLGEKLLEIHGQHEHHSLLKKETHTQILDAFGQLEPLADTTRQQFNQWQKVLRQLQNIRENATEQQARHQLLSYQVEELDNLHLQPGELEALEQEQGTLSAAETLLGTSQQLQELCHDSDASLHQGIVTAIQMITQLPTKVPAFDNIQELLNNALIQIDEAGSELQHFSSHFDINPQRLQEVNDRLDTAYDIARKHRTSPEQLLELHERLRTELDQLYGSDEQIEQLEQHCQQLEAQFLKSATALHKKRAKLAKPSNRPSISNYSSWPWAAPASISLSTPASHPPPTAWTRLNF